jgi:hypothetical protein
VTKTRILHIAPANTSGVPGQFVQSERQLDYDSRLVTLFADPRNYFHDICLDLPFIDFTPVRWVKRLVSHPQKLRVVNVAPKPEHIPIVWRPHTFAERLLVQARDAWWKPRIKRAIRRYALDDFDVYQLDGGLDLFRSASFITEMKRRRKKVICCYTGSDLRTRGVIEAIDAVADVNVTVEFDHLRLHPNIHHVFFPFDANRFSQHEHHDNNRPVRIGHAPTNRAAKGSDIIIPILQHMATAHPVEVVLIEGMPYQRALEVKQSCDIFVDQIGDLGYGINSLEALAMGIPVCSCLAAGFADRYPDNPFVDVQAENLQAELIPLIEQPELRRQKGEQGRQWVKASHDAVSVVRKIHQLADIF